jgi:cytidylate kinase
MTEERIVAELLDRESLTQLIERRLEQDSVYYPVITISREPGSGGKPIGKLLAKKMGFHFYDKSLIEKVAKRMKLDPELVEKVDEKSRSRIVDLVHTMLNPDYVSDEAYFRNLCQVILRLSHKGKSIIVGRGGNFLVPSAYSLRVQVVAPYRLRVARAVDYEHVSRDEAREIIRKVTADRVNFVRQYIGKNISSSRYYDVTLSTTFYSLEDAVSIIMKANKQKYPKVKFLK